MRNIARSLLTLVIAVAGSDAYGWNTLGHKVIAEIAWQRLSPEQRTEIVHTLRRHPRFDEDFAKRIEETDEPNHLTFLHAATWPDIARGINGPDREKFDMGSWHYVNFPLLIDDTQQPARVNLSMGPPTGPADRWNVAQATRYCLVTIEGDGSPQAKALAYCWLFHLVGDMHQPMHSTALFCERFPAGDRGGNLIKTRQGGNLHSLWDNLLGRQHRLNDVRREVWDLQQNPEAWKVDVEGDLAEWIQESHQLAKLFAYSPEVIAAVETPGELQPVELQPLYLKRAGRFAGERITAAGLRLAALLDAEDKPDKGDPGEANSDAREDPFAAPASSMAPRSKAPAAETASGETGYWLNEIGGVRHNSGCRWYNNTKRGHFCGPSDGKPCGQCGG